MAEMKVGQEYKDVSDVFKDIKDVNDIAKHVDFENPTVIRGQTPEDIDDKCLKLCQQYLGGNWIQQTTDTIKVTRIVGGWVNQLYYCKINEMSAEESVPQEVTIKIDGGFKIPIENKALRDMIVSLVFSAKGLGPKVYGVFDKGIIQQYCKHRIFSKKELDNPKIVEQVFRKLAHVHALDVPIKKGPGDQFPGCGIVDLLAKAKTKFDLNKEMEEYNCDELKTFSFDDEIKWYFEKIKEIQSPIVFTHNDYRSSNLLITEPNDELVICDYDTSCYGYRGADFHDLYDQFGPELQPGFLPMAEDFPAKDSVMAPLIALYADECSKIHGKAYTDSTDNSVEHIIKEMKFFWAFEMLGMTLVTLSSDPDDKDSIFPAFPRKMAMELANHGVKNLKSVKKLLIDNKIVSP